MERSQGRVCLCAQGTGRRERGERVEGEEVRNKGTHVGGISGLVMTWDGETLEGPEQETA